MVPGDNSHLEGLRDSLTRADRVMDFARRLVRENGSVPQGIVSDFMEARTVIEREFVKCHTLLSGDLRARFKELLLKTKQLRPEVMSKGVEPLSDRIRGLLNDLMIDGGLSLSLTEELFDGKASHPTPLQTDLPVGQGPPDATTRASTAATHAKGQVSAQEPGANSASISPTIAVAALVLLGVAGIAVAWTLGAFGETRGNKLVNSRRIGTQDSAVPENLPARNQPADSGHPDARFDKSSAGYRSKLAPQSLHTPISPLDPEFDLSTLRSSEWPLLLLGLEQLIHSLEPERLRLPPSETRQRLERFALGAVNAEPKWIQGQLPFLDAFLAHSQKELQLTLFHEGGQVLLSDVLNSKGGPRLPLLLALCALGRAAGADLVLVTPTGIGFPLLAQQIRAGTATFDGEAVGLRPIAAREAGVAELLAELCEQLRPSLNSLHSRAAISAVILRCNGSLDVRQAREALADLQTEWFSAAVPNAGSETGIREVMRPVVRLLQPAICRTLMAADARGDATESARLLDLATASNDQVAAEKALLLLGERAEKGALYKNQLLSLAVASMLLRKGDKTNAALWFKRAMQEAPDDWSASLSLAELAEDAEEKRRLLATTYARGCRGPEFLRDLARRQALAGESLSALALLDDLNAQDTATIEDAEAAALLCLSLDRAKWAQERIARSRFKEGRALLRLDLIAELSLNGLSDRAKDLTRSYGLRGQDDPYIESLLQRFGG